MINGLIEHRNDIYADDSVQDKDPEDHVFHWCFPSAREWVVFLMHMYYQVAEATIRGTETTKAIPMVQQISTHCGSSLKTITLLDIQSQP